MSGDLRSRILEAANVTPQEVQAKQLLAIRMSLLSVVTQIDAMLATAVGLDDDPDHVEPVASDDPETCQHPEAGVETLTTFDGTVRLCSACGKAL